MGYTTYTLRRASRLVEPPTADPRGVWCGGWGLKTPGYPIRPQLHYATWAKVNKISTDSKGTETTPSSDFSISPSSSRRDTSACTFE
jgi:hypothetical protein